MLPHLRLTVQYNQDQEFYLHILEEHHLQSPMQFGFRKGQSTSDLLLLLAKSWHDVLDAGRPSSVIALDIAGAFDCVWHRGLMAKLEQLGITGDLLHLCSSYLTRLHPWTSFVEYLPK